MSKLPGQRVAILIDGQNIYLSAKARGSKPNYSKIMNALNGIDAIALADKVDVMVVLTGDSDFLALVHALKSRGVKVEIMSFPETTGRELIEAADAYFEITEEMLIFDHRYEYRH